jgi:hypothetical protein
MAPAQIRPILASPMWSRILRWLQQEH